MSRRQSRFASEAAARLRRADRDYAMHRIGVRHATPSEGRRAAAAGPTSAPIKTVDPETRAAIDAALQRRWAPMIFCVGVTAAYDIATRGRAARIVGRREGHPGGMVWRTIEEAEAFLRARRKPARSVYAVDAEWDQDTYQVEGEPCRRLLRDARIMRVAVVRP